MFAPTLTPFLAWALFFPTKDAIHNFTFGTINVMNYKHLLAPSELLIKKKIVDDKSSVAMQRKITGYLKHFLIKNAQFRNKRPKNI